MKHIPTIVFGAVVLIGGFALGHTYSEMIQTCPVLCDKGAEEQSTVSIFEVDEDVRDAYCNIRNEPVEIPRYITVETKCAITECDCMIDRAEGWSSCMRSYESVTSNKTPVRTEIKAKNYRR